MFAALSPEARSSPIRRIAVAKEFIPMNPQQNSIRTKWSMAIHVAILISATTVTAVGQTEDVIYRFLGANGYHPEGGLISDSAGDRFIFRPTVAL